MVTIPVIQEFIDGKLVFTVATTDIVGRIEEAKKNGEFPYEYGVTNIPNINEELKTRSLSVTNAVVVNGYSQKKDIANEFAAYLTGERAQNLYERTGRMPARKGVSFENPQAEAFGREYALSVPIPKMMATSNYWVQMEIAFTRVWSGESATDTLKALSEKIMTQVTASLLRKSISRSLLRRRKAISARKSKDCRLLQRDCAAANSFE